MNLKICCPTGRLWYLPITVSYNITVSLKYFINLKRKRYFKVHGMLSSIVPYSRR